MIGIIKYIKALYKYGSLYALCNPTSAPCRKSLHWPFQRMARLSSAISTVIIDEYGGDE